MDLCEVSYDDLGKRIEAARRIPEIVNRCDAAAGEYLAQPGVSLETAREFVNRAFLLDEVFRNLLDEAATDTLTVNSCMSTIMPISETTACLPLGLLNDDGYLAFCESDFVAIPAGILLHYVAARPVFFCNPSLPHRGIVTVSHCTAPRRMDGQRLEAVRILTHYESDYGARAQGGDAARPGGDGDRRRFRRPAAGWDSKGKLPTVPSFQFAAPSWT